MHKVIIDTDPGIDDAMAIHYAFASPQIDLLGLTTVFGNVYTDQATRNALFLAEQAGRRLPVSHGADKPRLQPANPPSHHVHGAEGFGNHPAPQPRSQPDNRSAVEFLSQTCRQHSGEVTLCPIGPLTNIAALLDYDPEIPRHVKRLVIMGGAVFCGGNVTKYAEANIWNDPHAAQEVFAADWDIDLIGLDVTTAISCDRTDFDKLRESAPRVGGFLADISEFYSLFYEGVLGRRACLMHDPAALIAVSERALFDFTSVPLTVICEGAQLGRTLADDSAHARRVNVAVSAQSEKIKNVFLEICAKADMIKDSVAR